MPPISGKLRINTRMRKFIRPLIVALLFTASLSYGAVRFNPYTNHWEGNICANQYAWTYVQFQPIGSFCFIFMPNGQRMQGVILNQ